MCRSIRPLFNFEPSASEAESRAAALQFVRKVSGMRSPSRINEAAFDGAVEEVARITARLLDELVTRAPPKNREREAERARARRQIRKGGREGQEDRAPSDLG